MVLLLWIFYVFSVLCLLCLCTRLFICALWSPAGKGLTSWLSFVVSNCEFVTFPLVSWVRCGIWLYGFLTFAPLLTLKQDTSLFVDILDFMSSQLSWAWKKRYNLGARTNIVIWVLRVFKGYQKTKRNASDPGPWLMTKSTKPTNTCIYIWVVWVATCDFPTMRYFDTYRLRRACAASC